ncbi:MAG TPA: STAS domain-containing protein [Rhodopila sp.]
MEGHSGLGPARSDGPNISAGPRGAGTIATMPQILDLTQATPLRDKLAALLDAGGLVLDAGAVERMSTPCAQVLLAAGRAAAAAGTPLRIINASTVFQAALADLGLQPEFSGWMD